MGKVTICRKCGKMPKKVIETRKGRPVVLYRCSCGRSGTAYSLFPKVGTKQVPEWTRDGIKSAEERAVISWELKNG